VCELIFFPSVSLVIPNVQNDVDGKQYQQYKRAILKHPYFPLHLEEELKILLLAVHVQTKKENKKMEDSENRIKDEPVSFHHSRRVEGQT